MKRGKAKLANASRAPTGPADASTQAHRIASILATISAFLLGGILVFSFLKPQDATSVFTGDALPQNLLCLIAATALAAAFSIGSSRIHLAAPQTTACLLGLAWLVVVTLMAGRENNPRVAWNGFWQFVSIAAIYFVTRGLMVDRLSRAAVLSILIAAGCGLAVHGLHQVFVSFPSQRAEYLADPEAILRQAGITDAPEGSAARMRFEDRLLGSKEPFATYALANSLATFLSSVLVLVVGAAIIGWRRKLSSPFHLTVLSLGGFVIFATWFLTLSRTAYVAVAATVAYWGIQTFLNDRSQATRTRVTRIAGLVAIVFTGCFIWLLGNDRLVLSQSLYSLRFRLDYWYGCVAILRDHWLLGIGLGNFQAYYPAYKLESASETVADPHNWFFDIAVTLTLPIAIGILIWLVHSFLPNTGENQSSDENEPSQCKSLHQSMLLGAIVGGSTIALGLLLLSGIDLDATLIAWPISGMIGWIAWPLAKHIASEHITLIRAAAVAIAVCLLASGSWQASGIAIPLVVLIAASQTQSHVKTSGVSRHLPLAVAAAGLLAFVFQSWMPVTRAWRDNESLEVASSAEEQLLISEKMLVSDPFDVRPLGIRGQILSAASARSPGDFTVTSRAARAAFDEWLKRDGTSFANWHLAAASMLEAASAGERLGQDNALCLEAADEYSSQAVARYPSSVALQVQAAAAAHLAGDMTRASEYLTEAQRLSDTTPHADKMINMQEILLPPNLLKYPSEIATQGGGEAIPSNGRANAELVARLLRTIWAAKTE